ncbi:alpha/beta hydrolase [Antrihabitans sp. YC3-6]|uniref:Alpha/beta hydrolase n=1 Tax=Antrihabitans stalagmiti TaxID=2799499 RepID=A0A934U1G5_9NOCA|nr:alpha/beta hydrolase [Antrihabitans stalagmiti]MBJ8337398.1 alpha/beta hydrolase [Antrihabitans stalagmiti]
MPTVTSKDGTTIAYETAGSGPALVLVDGALCWRESGVTPTLLPELAKHFTVYAYDRRGRGESTDTLPYANDREIEDLDAVMKAAGGSPFVCGFSSGAVLVMYAVQQGLTPSKVVLFEAPLVVVDDTDRKHPADAVEQLTTMAAEDRRGDAVTYFLVDIIGLPKVFMLVMKVFMRKGWNATRAVAHTLPYDISFIQRSGSRVPEDVAASITMPCAVFGGAKSPASMKKAVKALAAAIPGAELVEVPKQSHIVKPKMMTPALVEFLGGPTAS